MSNYPWFAFYPADYLRKVGHLPLATQGLWMWMLCRMDESPRRGVLLYPTGSPIMERDIPAMVIDTPGNVHRALTMLETHGILSREDGTGAMYSRRMVRDTERRGRERDKKRTGRGVSPAMSPTMSPSMSPSMSPPMSPVEAEAEVEAETEAEIPFAPTSARTPSRSRPPDSLRWEPVAGWAGISADDRSAWGIAYPAVDIDQELAKADQWLRANPAKAKKSLWRRFITNWLSRAQEHGGSHGRGAGTPAGSRAGTVGAGTPGEARRAAEADREYAPADGRKHGSRIKRWTPDDACGGGSSNGAGRPAVGVAGVGLPPPAPDQGVANG